MISAKWIRFFFSCVGEFFMAVIALWQSSLTKFGFVSFLWSFTRDMPMTGTMWCPFHVPLQIAPMHVQCNQNFIRLTWQVHFVEPSTFSKFKGEWNLLLFGTKYGKDCLCLVFCSCTRTIKSQLRNKEIFHSTFMFKTESLHY